MTSMLGLLIFMIVGGIALERWKAPKGPDPLRWPVTAYSPPKASKGSQKALKAPRSFEDLWG